MRLLPCFLAVLLAGCTSSLRHGDALADAGDWIGAYEAYSGAAARRPGAERPQQRLAEARAHVLPILSETLGNQLQRADFASAGQTLWEAERFAPPADWLAQQQRRAQEALTEHLRQRVERDGALAAAGVLGRAHRAFPPALERAPLNEMVSDKAAAEARAHQDAGRFAEALSLLDAVASALPDPTALHGAQAEVRAGWRASLEQRAAQDARAGKLGGAVVHAAGAEALGGAPRGARLSALVEREWGGLVVSVSGPQRDLLREELSASWAASSWGALAVRSSRPRSPHLLASVRMTEARCVREVVHTEQRQHSYRDGTFVPNPEIPALEAQMREADRELFRRQEIAEDTQRWRAAAADQLRWAQEEVARQAPLVEAARREDRAAERRLQEAQQQLDASLQAQAQVVEREREVQLLLRERDELARAKRTHEQSVAEAQVRHERAAAALQAAEAAQAEATEALRAAEAEVRRLEAELAEASRQLQSLPAERDRLRAEQRDGQAALQSLRQAVRDAAQAHQRAEAEREAVEAQRAPLEQQAWAAAQALEAAHSEVKRVTTELREVSTRLERTTGTVESLTEKHSAATTDEERERLSTMLADATRRQERLTERAASLEAAKASAEEALQDAAEADESAKAALAALGDPQEHIRAEETARRALAEAEARLEAEEAAQATRTERLESISQEIAEAERARDTASRALSGARSAEGRAQQVLSSKTAAVRPLRERAESAAGTLRERRAALESVASEEARVQARLTELDAELGALSSSVGLLPSRRSELEAARRGRKKARARLADAESALAPLMAAEQAAALEDQDAAVALEQGRRAVSEQQQRLSGISAARAAAPERIELLKQAAYTVRTWERRCRVSGQAGVSGQAEGWSDALVFAAVDQDVTWDGRDEIGLAGDPLVFSGEDAAVLAGLRGSLHQAVWGAVEAQMPREAARIRAQAGAEREAATRALVLAHWMAPSSDLGAFVQAEYAIPPVVW